MFGRFTATRRITEATAAIAAPAADIPVLPPEEAPSLQLVQELPKLEPNPEPAPSNSPLRDKLLDAKVRLHRRLIEEINLSAIEKVSEGEVRRQISALVSQYVLAERIALNAQELEDFVDEIIDEMTGLGPIEPLLKDPSVNDILINGHECVYVERAGMLEPTPVRFKDEAHLLRIVNKIVSAVGRRVDESHPLCDARLLDGSRVNVAVRPIGVDGPLVSIRKFSKKPFNINKLVEVGALRPQMAEVLGAAVKARVSAIISGGTGSGKTTMLNALSAFISEKERLLTIEDAAELQLQQDHIVRLETRPPNIEGKGAVTATAHNRRSMFAAGQRPVTTNRNNLNLLRIFSFRSKLQTLQSVSMPSCAIMKLNRGCFTEGNTKPLIIQRFQDSNSFPFNKATQKNRSVFSGFQDIEPAALCKALIS